MQKISIIFVCYVTLVGGCAPWDALPGWGDDGAPDASDLLAPDTEQDPADYAIQLVCLTGCEQSTPFDGLDRLHVDLAGLQVLAWASPLGVESALRGIISDAASGCLTVTWPSIDAYYAPLMHACPHPTGDITGTVITYGKHEDAKQWISGRLLD